jgi:tRNA (cmo5U34)-methyltransferase
VFPDWFGRIIIMSVAAHLNIRIEEYDARIRTFVPTYEEMISTAAEILRLLRKQSPTVLDLGIGTGELADRCHTVHPAGQIVGIDIDPAMLEVARKRLEGRAAIRLIKGDIREVVLPPCDAIVSCIALHHVPSPKEKKRLYEKCAQALQPGGLFVSADCFPASEESLAKAQRESWLAHLRKTYSPAEAETHLASWAGEDFYFPLSEELQWLQESGLKSEVVWRQNAFAVIMGHRRD